MDTKQDFESLFAELCDITAANFDRSTYKQATFEIVTERMGYGETISHAHIGELTPNGEKKFCLNLNFKATPGGLIVYNGKVTRAIPWRAIRAVQALNVSRVSSPIYKD